MSSDQYPDYFKLARGIWKNLPWKTVVPTDWHV